MALEAVVFPHDQLWHSVNNGGIPWGAYEIDPALTYYTGGQEMPASAAQELLAQGARDRSCTSHLVEDIEKWEVNSSLEADVDANDVGRQTLTGGGRRKRRRAKACKNKEEAENQRMTHIAVERNRRKQMNEYLAVLRTLMPPSYVQRGDQASIVGGAINFVRELEQLLQYLEAQKRLADAASGGGFSASLFAHVFTFPQYSTSSSFGMVSTGKAIAENRSAIADIEVTMVESHANLKVMSRRRHRQLLKMAVGLQGFRLTILHLNVTTVEQMVLYSFSLKVEDDCILSSADEIAAAVHQMLVEILGEIGLI